MVLEAYCHDVMIVVLLTHVAFPFVLRSVLKDRAAAWATEFQIPHHGVQDLIISM